MTTEQIIQRLLDEKHITVAEAIQMIKDLVRNEVFIPVFPNDGKKPYPGQTTVVMYGVGINNTEYNNDDATYTYSSKSLSDKPKED